MQINRLFKIVYLLLNKKKLTAGELADHFEVSKRTILRDIDTLSMAGIPIYTSQGKGGGIFILDNFTLNKTTVSEEEQNQILFALQSLSSTELINGNELLGRLRTLFDKTETDWIEVDFSRWGNQAADKEKFEILKQAVIKKQAVSFTYPNSYGEITSRTVYPLKLIFKSKSWYLQGYCLLRQGYRTFKINRMLSVEITPETFADRQLPPPPIETQGVSTDVFIHVKLKFSPHAAYRVYDELGIQNIVKDTDGSLFVSIDLPDDDWLYGFLLSFGTAVQVIEPRGVKENLLRRIDKIKNIYL